MTFFGVYLSSTDIILLAVNALMATSLYLTMVVGVFSLGQVAFMAIGAYGFAYTTSAHGWPPALGLLGGCLVALAVAAVLSLPILRVAGIYLGILTIALIYMVQYLVGATPALGQVGGLYGPLETSPVTAWTVLLVALVVLTIGMRLPVGKALRAIGEDEPLARSLGIYTPGVKVAAFVVGGLLAGLAGALYSNSAGYTAPALFGVDRAILIVLYAVVGGFTAAISPALGAIALTVLSIVLRRYDEWGVVITGVIVLVAIVTRPRGLFAGLNAPIKARLGVFARAARVTQR